VGNEKENFLWSVSTVASNIIAGNNGCCFSTVVASPPTTREEATRRPGASATPKGWIKAPKTDSPSLLTQKGKEGAKDIGQRLGGCLLILVPVAFALVLFMERRGRR